ncbi:MAG TPA: DUF1648 domain-containing protein, partial [Myxococcales bacterium]|nr:DUF1648 domain-containing protein [Myxococcales bacterium]
MNDIREADLEPDESGLPGGTFGQLLPFLLLVSGAIWLYLNWDSVPDPVPMHWNVRGHVDRYVSRSPVAVAMPLLISASTCLMLHFIARIIRGAAPRGATRKPSLRLLLIAEIFIAGVCCAVVMVSASNGRLFVPGVTFIAVLTAALLGTCIVLFAKVPKTQPRNPAGYHPLYYSDPEDPALFVPKRSGLGYTVN